MVDPISPTDDEIRRLAYQCFELRDGEHGWHVADWLVAERAARFFKNYDRVVVYPFSSRRRIILGGRQPRACRYCGQSAARVGFSQEVHAIPAFLGNCSVFSHYECDECNNAFSEYLEDHFAKMLHGLRTIIRVKGRKTVPSYKTTRKLTRIDVVANRIEVAQNVADPVVEVDQENQSATFNLETQPFIPLAVYKCMAKIALSVMPESELPHFARTMTWVRDRDHTRGDEDFTNAFMYRAFTPGPFPERHGRVELCRRRHDLLRIPYMVLIVACMNLTFQAYVPLCQRDEHLLGEVPFPLFPADEIFRYEYGKTEFKNMDLSSPVPTVFPSNANMRSVT